MKKKLPNCLIFLDDHYLSQPQKELIDDGITLLNQIAKDKSFTLSDYSFIVAPFAKAYEGYLKKMFLNLNLISEKDYYSKNFRVGKVLNPNLRRKGFSVYRQLENMGEDETQLAEILWNAWKEGRNKIFHYFPKNLQKLSLAQAEERIKQIIFAINQANSVLDKYLQS